MKSSAAPTPDYNPSRCHQLCLPETIFQLITLITLQSIWSARNRIYPFQKKNTTEDQRQLNKVKIKYFKSKINVQKVR